MFIASTKGRSSSSGPGLTNPFVTSTFFIPAARNAFEQSSTNSNWMSGSL
jgi:hypothetical protein